MAILVWDETNVSGMEGKDISRVLTEVNGAGTILREIGLDADSRVLYIAPAHRGRYPFGLFDLQSIDPSGGLRTEFPQEQFEALWNGATERFGGRTDRTVTSRKPK